MRSSIATQTPEQIADALMIALKRAMYFFEPGRHEPDGPSDLRKRFAKLCERFNHDPRLVDVNEYQVTFSHHMEISFGIGVEVSPKIEWDDHDGLQVTCDLSWGTTGSKSPTTAVAEARLHLDTAERACQCQNSMADAVRHLRGAGAKEYKLYRAGLKLFSERLHRANEIVRDAFVDSEQRGAQ